MVRVASHQAWWRSTAILFGGATIWCALAFAARANPQGASVAAGTVTVTAAGRTLTVNQSTNRAIVNWQSFSVGAGETTRINLPSSLSAILNRVTGSDPSSIAGQISSNGQVYLINPNGIVIGPNGRINTSAFVASTLNISDTAFMRGGGMTFRGDSGAGIKVFGKIAAANGDVVLVAAMVDNQGRITAPNGQAILGAGGQFYYVPDGSSDIVIAGPPASGPGSVSNSGVIAAANAQLRAAGNPYAMAVNNSGLISATSVRQIGGRVVLDGGAGDTTVTGSIAARAATNGGSVTVTGGRVTVGGNGTIDASGPTGGGTIRIGGGTRGGDPTVANANATTIAPGARRPAARQCHRQRQRWFDRRLEQRPDHIRRRHRGAGRPQRRQWRFGRSLRQHARISRHIRSDRAARDRRPPSA